MAQDQERTLGVHSERPREGARPALAYVLLGMLSFQGLSGLAGGIGLLYDPSGVTLGIPLEWLEGSPLTDYAIPGLVLLMVLGLGPLVVAYGAWLERPWAWMGSVAVGATLVVWLAVEILVIGYQSEPPLQLIYGVVAAVILMAALAPQVKAHLVSGGASK